MGRATYGAARASSKKRVFRKVEGYRGPLGKRWRLVQEAVVRAGVNAFRDRRRRKRLFRALWITRLTAACRAHDMNYSRFIYGLLASDIEVNRKMLSEIAVHSPADFLALVELARKTSPKNAGK